jgi:hypothetical protein
MTTTEKNITDQLSDMCKDAGSNLGAVCLKVGVQRPVLERWKYKTPDTLVNYLASDDKKAYLKQFDNTPRAIEIYLAIKKWCDNNTQEAI